MKRVLCSVLFCASAYIFAQTGTVSGKINDENKIALPGAKIKLTPGNIFTTSDANGNFVFLSVPEGNYTMTVDYLGYGTASYPITVNESGIVQNILLDQKATTIEAVNVVGFGRQSQARALNTQKNNPNITNVISTEQIGKFPDSNIGDALKRVPGITMQNDQGEARDIIIRGLAPELNSVTLNGNRIPSAEGDNRKVQMDLIPSDMIQLIEVNKTLTSDMDADAIGGSVNLNTKTPTNKERLSLTTASGFNPIRNKFAFNNGFFYGNRFFGGAVGLALNGSYNLQDYGSDNVEAVWKEGKTSEAFIGEMDIRKYDVKRERKSVGANLDFKINSKNALTLGALYNWRDDLENRYRLRFNSVKENFDKNTGEFLGYTADLRAQTKGGIGNDLNKGSRLERQIMQNYFITGDHIIGSKIDMDWGASYSRAEEQRPNERYTDYQVKGVALDKNFDSEEQPLLKPLTQPALKDFKFRTLTEQNGMTFEDEITGKLNFRFPFSIISEQKGRLRIGGKARIKTKERDNNFFDYKPVAANTLYSTLDKVNRVFWNGKNYNPSEKYVPGWFASKEHLGGLNLKNSAMFTESDEPAEYLGVNYKAKENIYAGYLRWDQNFSDVFSMIAGLRLENTQIDYTGNVIQDEEDLTGTRQIENDYTNYLPSLAFKYTPVENLVLRAAYSTALARPSYYKLSPFVSIIPGDNDISAGNPNLKASYAHNFDVMAEKYFKSVGLISLGGFYKKINDFIYDYRDNKFSYDKFSAEFPDVANVLVQGEDYTFLQSKNGESVNVYGFEVAVQKQLDFLLGFAKFFNLYANYTYTKSEAKGIYAADGTLREGLMLPGTAPHMFNASLAWENKKFSARISLNHAAAYLDELGADAFEDRYYDKQTFVDFNASYAIKEWMRFFVEANNLTNQPLRYYQGVKNRTAQMEYYMPRYTFGFKFDF